jgi:hypothetical protein
MSDKLTITTETLFQLGAQGDEVSVMDCPVTGGSDKTGDGGTCYFLCTRNDYTEVCWTE